MTTEQDRNAEDGTTKNEVEYSTEGMEQAPSHVKKPAYCTDEEEPSSNTSNHEEDSEDTSFPFPVGDVTCWKTVRSPFQFGSVTFRWLAHNKSQILSGLTVALAQVPEAVSFSFVAGLDPIVGLHSAWIMGICTSLFGGRPGMVVRSLPLKPY